MDDRSQAQILRVIDANANRAREALRVLEDYARFVLDSSALSASLKELRHGLAEALRSILPQAIVHRDTPNDVGVANKTAAEMSRDDLSHVITAAGKRLGEALRSLEEFAKTSDSASAAQIESLRYRFYSIEQTVALTLRPRLFAQVRLYVLISSDHCLNRPWQDVAEAAIIGGADCLQLREKGLEGGELFKRAQQFVAICRRHNVLSIINDRVDVAAAADADGVHLGQGDLPARAARSILGTRRIIGVSTHQLDHARQAVLDGADYIGVGPIFPSSTKSRSFLAGLEYARQAASNIPLPAVGISGINAGNLDEVLATGLRAVAVTAAITEQPDPADAARELKKRMTSASAAPFIGAT